MKHTSAPWSYSLSEYKDHTIKGAGGQIFIADVLKMDTDEATEANAKLIAMAPELLACCKSLLDEMTSDHPGLSSYKHDIIRNARSVIKKASE